MTASTHCLALPTSEPLTINTLPDSFIVQFPINIMSDATGTVKFNVGGRHFEVSRALIDGHSETVLGKLVSETWNNDPGKAVFIDRSGDIFAHVLEYLRYGR